MLLSMTGFGEARCQEGALAIAVEVRAINNRYFKLSLRSSEGYGGLEPLVEAVARKYVKRGTLQVQIRIDRARLADDFRLNLDVLEGYRRQLETHYQRRHMQEPVKLEALLLLPGVVDDSQAATVDATRDWPVIERALETSLAALAKMRAEEGAALAADLRTNCQLIRAQLDRIEARLPQVADEYRERLIERVNRILEKHDVKIDQADIIREVSLYVERSDISEEIVRLRSHLEQVDATMGLAEGSGRKLDFLTQEMFREANTIGSKSSDVEIAKYVIETKAAVERMREQVQNVE